MSGIKKISVLLTPENGLWVAQCLEIDICAQGNDTSSAILALANEIIDTIHICRHENVESFKNRGAAPDYYHKLYNNGLHVKTEFEEFSTKMYEDLPQIIAKVA